MVRPERLHFSRQSITMYAFMMMMSLVWTSIILCYVLLIRTGHSLRVILTRLTIVSNTQILVWITACLEQLGYAKFLSHDSILVLAIGNWGARWTHLPSSVTPSAFYSYIFHLKRKKSTLGCSSTSLNPFKKRDESRIYHLIFIFCNHLAYLIIIYTFPFLVITPSIPRKMAYNFWSKSM